MVTAVTVTILSLSGYYDQLLHDIFLSITDVNTF